MTSQNASGGVVGKVTALTEPITQELGLLLWDVRFVKEGATWILRVVIDREDTPVSIDDCVNVTHRLNPLLDEADPIPQSYCLEVTSPGADRELTRPEHLAYYEGWPVKVTLYRPDEQGQREFVGLLGECTESTVCLDADGTDMTWDKKAVAAVHAVDEWDDVPEEEQK